VRDYSIVRGVSARRAAIVVIAGVYAAACAADPGDDPKVPSDGGPANDSGFGSDGNGFDAHGGDDGNNGFDTGGQTDSGSSSDADASAQDTGATQDAQDAPPSDSSLCGNCPLVVQYRTTTSTPTTQDIRAHYDIYNNGNSAQPLTELTVRYWFTADGSTSQTYACDYAQLGCGNIASKFVTMGQAKPTADHYLEISFTGGTPIAANGGHSGEIQNRFHDTNYQVTFTQTNDYSFDGTKTSYTPWDHVTLYRNGQLVWGVEP
jgi:endo-1,4-beta-xylanase